MGKGVLACETTDLGFGERWREERISIAKGYATCLPMQIFQCIWKSILVLSRKESKKEKSTRRRLKRAPL